MVGDEQAARDLSQDIWVKVYRNLDNFRGHAAVFTWIYRIAINHILNYLKQQKRKRWLNLLDLSLRDALRTEETLAWHNATATEDNPAEQLQQKEREQIVWRQILKLPESQRAPLVLHRYEGLSYQEIARVLGISLSSVESRLHRAKKNLQKWLEPYLGKI
jgi:RNA polymerase sigma-70 factor (ECF subfamily)